MVGAAGAGAGAELGTGVGAGVGAWSQAGADADSMTGADSDAASGLAMESVGSTEMDVSSVPVLASGLRSVLCLDVRLGLDRRGYHGGDAGVGVLGVVDNRERDGRLGRLGLRCCLGSILIRELVGLIVLGVVAKDIVVLEHGRLGLASRLFDCRLGASLSSTAASCSA